MDLYEKVLQKAADMGLKVIENCHFQSDAKGMISGNKIGLSADLQTSAEKLCVLMEELAHAQLSCTDILDTNDWHSRHEEVKARRLSHDQLIDVSGLVRAVLAGCQSLSEAAEYLNVTPEFLAHAITEYRHRYGEYIERDGYIITLNPIGIFRRW